MFGPPTLILQYEIRREKIKCIGKTEIWYNPKKNRWITDLYIINNRFVYYTLIIYLKIRDKIKTQVTFIENCLQSINSRKLSCRKITHFLHPTEQIYIFLRTINATLLSIIIWHKQYFLLYSSVFWLALREYDTRYIYIYIYRYTGSTEE